VTLYHLVGVIPDETGLLDALDIKRLDELDLTPRFPDIPGNGVRRGGTFRAANR
jgi:hypothetical protein